MIGGREDQLMAQAAVSPIDSVLRSYEAAYNAGDASALAGLFTEDAVLMPPEAPISIGQDGVKSYYQAYFDHFSCVLNASVDESGTLGDSGFARGTFTASLTPKAGGEPIQIIGKWLNISRIQADGSWRVAQHIWNVPIPPILAGA
jgi:uncharacterized protein (TIGR02246 family)